jgi:hypothetical protein
MFEPLTDRDVPSVTVVYRPLSHADRTTSCSPAPASPVLLVAAILVAVAVVSWLAKRPRAGLALTRRTRPRSSCSEGDEPSLEGQWYGNRPTRSDVPAGLPGEVPTMVTARVRGL